MSNLKKVLIIGHTNVMGGVETFIRNITLFSNKTMVSYYFLIHGDNDCLFKDEITEFYEENHFFFINTSFRKKPFSTVIALMKFYKQHHDFDFIHLHTGAASEIVYCFPYCKRYGIPLIVHSHNGGNLGSFISHQLFIPLVNKSVKIRLACSKVAAEYMFGKKYIWNTQVIPVGIDLQRFKFCNYNRIHFRNEYNIPEDSFVIGVVGRFTEQKNQLFALEIFSQLVKKRSDSILVLKGQGELEKELYEKTITLGIQNKVIIVNRIENMTDLYSALDIFLMPSLFEGLPQVAVEAQASGLPCIFSDTISKEVLLTEDTRMLSLNDSVKIWTDAIIDFEITKKDRMSGYNSVKEKGFDIRDTVRTLQEVYFYE